MITRPTFVTRVAGVVAVGASGGLLWARLAPPGVDPTPITEGFEVVAFQSDGATKTFARY